MKNRTGYKSISSKNYREANMKQLIILLFSLMVGLHHSPVAEETNCSASAQAKYRNQNACSLFHQIPDEIKNLPHTISRLAANMILKDLIGISDLMCFLAQLSAQRRLLRLRKHLRFCSKKNYRLLFAQAAIVLRGALFFRLHHRSSKFQ